MSVQVKLLVVLFPWAAVLAWAIGRAEMRRKMSVLEGRVGDLESENKALRSRVAMLEDEIQPILNPRVCA